MDVSFANWLLPCMFPKLYFTDYSTIHKKRYNVNRRRITVGMIILQEWWMLTKMPVLNLVEAKPVLFFGGILNVSVFAIFALCILPRCEKKQVMYTVGMWIFVWSIPATAFLIVAGTQKEVVSYERGMVEEKRTSDSEDSDNYYVIVVKDDGTEHKYKVTDGLYSQIE